MPGGDGTGPMGMGSRTGRGAGLCAGYSASGFANRGFGSGNGAWGRGGGGRGWRHWFHMTGLPGWMRFGYRSASQSQVNPEIEKQAIRSQAAALQSELDLIKKRLDQIEPGNKAQ